MKIGQTIRWVEKMRFLGTSQYNYTDSQDYHQTFKGMVVSFDDEVAIVQEIPWSMSKPLVKVSRRHIQINKEGEALDLDK